MLSKDQPPAPSPGKSPHGHALGLGIHSLTSNYTLRSRSYTIDSLNISSIESYKPARSAAHGPQDLSESNWEKATWLFSDTLLGIGPKDKADLAELLAKCNQLVNLLIEHPSLKNEIVIENVVFKIQFMLHDPQPQLRIAAYRVLRHTIAGEDAPLLLVHLKLLIFLILSLLTPTPSLEKEEALKLIRQFLAVPNGANYLSVGVIKALVALVENESEDTPADQDVPQSNASPSLTRMCVETIAELAVVKPDIVFHGGGLRLLIYVVVNGSTESATIGLLTLMTLLDLPSARLFLRNGLDLESLTAIYTYFEDDDEGEVPNTKKYYNKALRVTFLLSCFLKNWTGLICYSHKRFHTIRLLLAHLKKKNNKLCGLILDLLLDILRIKSISWIEGSRFGDTLSQLYYITMGNNTGPTLAPSFEYAPISPRSFEYGVVSHYQGLLLKVLMTCDLLPLLFDVVNHDRDAENTAKTTLLLTNVFDICAKFLPPEFYNTHILSAYKVNLSLTSLGLIETATRLRQDDNQHTKQVELRSIVRNLGINDRLEMDEAALKACIASTRVVGLRNFEEWSWSQLLVVFQGPLRSPQRFAEMQDKYPKFLKSVLSFLRPFKRRFSLIPIRPSSRYPKLKKPTNVIAVACQLFEGLLSHDEGTKYLTSSKFMAQLIEILAQVNPLSRVKSNDPLLSKRRLENTLSVGYLKFIGVFSASPRGVRVLEQTRLLQSLNDIVLSSGKDELNNSLMFTIFSCLDYTAEGSVRNLLTKAMSVSNWKVKMFALELVIPKLSHDEACGLLLVNSLVNLLYDSNNVVVTMAVELLHDYLIVRGRTSKINAFISRRPSVTMLKESPEGMALILHCCTTSKGFKYLLESGFIDMKFDECISRLQDFEFLDSIETRLRVLLFPFLALCADLHLIKIQGELRHFFHYLLATEEGLAYFSSKRVYIDEIVAKIGQLSLELESLGTANASTLNATSHPPVARTSSSGGRVPSRKSSRGALHDEPPMPPYAQVSRHESYGSPAVASLSTASLKEKDGEETDSEYMMKRLKQYIWIVGEIASAPYGMQLLEPVYSGSANTEHIAETLTKMFQSACNWQLRGLAFYQLGRMASTVEGVELLDEMGWASVETDEPHRVCLAYPQSMLEEGFTSLEILDPYKDESYFSLFGADAELQLRTYYDPEDEVVIESYEELDDKLLSLINSVASVLGRVERRARKELLRIKAADPEVFRSTVLFLKTIRLIDKGKFKFRTRAFIFDLFDCLQVMEMLVKKTRKSSSVRRRDV